MTAICMTDRDINLFPVTASFAPRVRWHSRADVAVLPGEAATADAIARDKARSALIELVQKFYDQGFSWSAGINIKISSHTIEAARAFFRVLPDDVILPKISPDGEGGLLMAWESRDKLVMAVIDGWLMHLVDAATTTNAVYLDDILFDGNRIPSAIMDALPIRRAMHP